MHKKISRIIGALSWILYTTCYRYVIMIISYIICLKHIRVYIILHRRSYRRKLLYVENMMMQHERYFKHGLYMSFTAPQFSSLCLSKYFLQFAVFLSSGNYFPLFLIHNFIFVTMWSQLVAKSYKFWEWGDAWGLVGSDDKCIQRWESWVRFFCSIIKVRKIANLQWSYDL
jgi:hypothetical protein